MASKNWINVFVDADGGDVCPPKPTGSTVDLDAIIAVELATLELTDVGDLGDLAAVDEVANIVDDDTAAATTESTGWALANALQAKLNALLAALKAAGVMTDDT